MEHEPYLKISFFTERWSKGHCAYACTNVLALYCRMRIFVRDFQQVIKMCGLCKFALFHSYYALLDIVTDNN